MAGSLGLSVFNGQVVSASSILIRYTLAADANLDATVDTLDFNLLATNFGQSGKDWTNGDFTYNSTVDTLDFNLLATNFGQMFASIPFSARSDPVAIVPESSVMILLLAAPFASLLRRKRKNDKPV